MAFYWKKREVPRHGRQHRHGACIQPAACAGGSSRAFDKPMADPSFKMPLDFISQLHIEHYLALGEVAMHHR